CSSDLRCRSTVAVPPDPVSSFGRQRPGLRRLREITTRLLPERHLCRDDIQTGAARCESSILPNAAAKHPKDRFYAYLDWVITRFSLRGRFYGAGTGNYPARSVVHRRRA